MGRLQDRVALITGAGRGIGRGVARRFAREGARVVVAEIDPRTGAAVAGEIEQLGSEARFVRTDVCDPAQLRAAVRCAIDGWGRIDILVNNAWGGGSIGRIEWKTDEEMSHALRINLMAAFWAMQAVLPHMRAQGGGRIINMCSLNGVNAHMYSLAYNASKEALRTLTRTAAVEWGRHGILCNALCPAAATEAYLAFRDANPEAAAEMLEQNPLRRMGDPEEDIGAAALFLASEDSRYVTGNTLFVDGGSHVNGVHWAPVLPDEQPG